MEAARIGALEAWLTGALGAERVTISGPAKLSGGAIQENWALDLDVTGGPEAGRHEAVLRTDAPSGVAVSHSRVDEFTLVRLAHGLGMTVPRPIAVCPHAGVIGAPFFLVARVGGTANARRIVRDPDVGRFGPALARRLGEELAVLHTVRPPRDGLAFLGDPPADVLAHRIATYRRYLDEMDAVEPTLEWGLRWLERHAPAPEPVVLTHLDFRMGNVMVENGRLTAILDWEFAGWGDPREDVAWLCAKCWRFGAVERTAGGIAQRKDFLDGYNARAPRAYTPADLAFFEALGTVRWAIIALQQGHRFHVGGEQNLELPLTGLMVPELCHDLLDYLAPEPADG